MRTLSFWLGLVLIFFLPWERFVHVEGLGTISRMVGVVVAGVWLVSAILNGVRMPQQVHFLIFAFVLINVASIFWSVAPEETYERAGTYIRVGLLSVILWDLYRTADSVRMALQAFVLGSLAPACSTIYNYISGTQTEYGRYSTAGDNMNTTAFVLALGVPIALYLALEARSIGSKWMIWMRPINYGCVMASMFAIGLTATRFAVLMTVPAAIYALAMLIKSGKARGMITVAGLMVCLVVSLSFLPEESIERLATTQQELSGGDLNGRTVVWKIGLTTWAEHPILGIGSGASAQPSIPVLGFAQSMHNSFLAILVEVGLLGFAFVAAILAVIARHVMEMDRKAAVFWVVALAVLLLGNMPLTCFHTKETWLILSLVISYPAAAHIAKQSEPQPELQLAA